MKRQAIQLAAYFLQKYDHKKIGLKFLLADEYKNSIKNSYFVSSRGILQSCDVKPCGSPTNSILSYIYICGHCKFKKEEMFPNKKTTEDPGYCDYCNP